MEILDFIIKLLDVIIWPLTLLIILGFFKSELKNFFAHLKSFQANKDGVKFEAFENKVQQAKNLFTKIPKAKSDRGLEIGTSSYNISNAMSNKAQILEWNEELINKIKNKAGDSTLMSRAALEKLNKTGQINFSDYKAISALLDLAAELPTHLDSKYLKEFQKMYKSLNI